MAGIGKNREKGEKEGWIFLGTVVPPCFVTRVDRLRLTLGNRGGGTTVSYLHREASFNIPASSRGSLFCVICRLSLRSGGA